MQAIFTKFLPASVRGARIKATTTSGLSVIIPYPYELDGVHAHYAAVQALADKHKLDWPIDEMSYGGSREGYAFVFTASKI